MLHKTKRSRFRRCRWHGRGTGQQADRCSRLGDDRRQFLLCSLLVAQRLQQFTFRLVRLFDIANLLPEKQRAKTGGIPTRRHLLHADVHFWYTAEHLFGEHLFRGLRRMVGDEMFADVKQCVLRLLERGEYGVQVVVRRQRRSRVRGFLLEFGELLFDVALHFRVFVARVGLSSEVVVDRADVFRRTHPLLLLHRVHLDQTTGLQLERIVWLRSAKQIIVVKLFLVQKHTHLGLPDGHARLRVLAERELLGGHTILALAKLLHQFQIFHSCSRRETFNVRKKHIDVHTLHWKHRSRRVQCCLPRLADGLRHRHYRVVDGCVLAWTWPKSTENLRR